MAADMYSTVIGSLEITIRLFRSIHKAIGNAKDLPTVIATHREEITLAKAIVTTVKTEPELEKNEGILKAVEGIGGSAVAVQNHLNSLGGKTKLEEIAHQLLKGEKEKHTLDALMDKLSRQKNDLRTLIDTLSLATSRRLENTLKDIATRYSEAVRYTKRKVVGNTARGRAFMINAPVLLGSSDKDPWADVDEVEVSNNVASEDAFMVNYGTTVEVLNKLADEILTKVRAQVEEEA